MSKSFTANLSLNSSTLFPQTAAVNNLVTQVVSGSAGFDILIVSQSSTRNLFLATEADASSTVYFYAQALSTNTDQLTLSITGSNTSGSTFVRLRPGDMTYIPLNVTSASFAVNCINSAATKQDIYVFYGQRS
jgi:hypothetical protein